MTARPLSSPGIAAAAGFWRRFRRHRFAVASAAVLAFLVLLAASAPAVEWILGIDPGAVDLANRLAGPGLHRPLGSDELGRDVFVRLLYGGRVSLFVGLVAALVSAVIGTALGLLAGYYGGRADAILMRLTDGVIALPLLPLLIVLAASDPTKLGVSAAVAGSPSISLYRIVAIIALVGWTTVARLVRGATLSLRERDYVLSAISQGAGPLRIMLLHILPHAVSPIVVATTLSVGNVILFESVLSFLGLGIQPPIPSWGNMLSNAQDLIWTAPALATYPGLAILLTVLSFNFLGDGLQDALDPRAERP